MQNPAAMRGILKLYESVFSIRAESKNLVQEPSLRTWSKSTLQY